MVLAGGLAVAVVVVETTGSFVRCRLGKKEGKREHTDISEPQGQEMCERHPTRGMGQSYAQQCVCRFSVYANIGMSR